LPKDFFDSFGALTGAGVAAGAGVTCTPVARGAGAASSTGSLAEKTKK
jgi:hypothetical protein